MGLPEVTEEKEIKDKLRYIGLNLQEIPSFLEEESDLNFRIVRAYENKTYRVYQHIPVNKIQILLTPANRLESINKKYSTASSICSYLQPKKEEDILKHTIFLKMLKDMNISEIEQLEEEQRKFKTEVPFKVKYNSNYLWQIYYSEEDDRYFMLFSTEEVNTSALFYLLKQQILCFRTGKCDTIFAPVSNLEYSREYLKKSEFLDIEKYLWLFTKEWPFTYEVYDIKGKKSIQIVGNTVVYEKIKSYYKIVLNTKEEASKFYKLIKALFILQTELPHYYHFETKISSNGGLEFLYDSKLITYDNLSKVIKEEYQKVEQNLKEEEKQRGILAKQLQELKKLVSQKNQEYHDLEKKLTTYLECRKTFFGKVKYFFRSRKKEKIKQVSQEKEKVEEKKEDLKQSDSIIQNKDFYTIEDLLQVTKVLQQLSNEVKNIKLDLEALEYRHKNIELKIENANQYMKEIENHKKSIFEFWKFANKDENLALNPGEALEQKVEPKKIEKTFDYEEDIKDISIQFDKYQRRLLTEQECDSIYIATTNVLKDLNTIKENSIKGIEQSLENLKQEAETEKALFSSEEFDIFGNISEDKTKIKTLGSSKHRENQKDKIQILEVTKNMTVEEYTEKLKKTVDQIDGAFSKLNSIMNLDLYMTSDKVLNTDEFGVFTMNPEHAIHKVKGIEKINLYRVHIKEKMPIIVFSNIIYYDNTNKTLPLGADVEDGSLIDMSQFHFELKRQKLFRMNQEIDEIHSKIKIICVYEYDLKLKT